METKTIDKALDDVLRAAGSGLKHYSMQKTKDDMRAAMRRAIESDPVRADLLASLEYLVRADEDIQENRGLKSDQAMGRIAALDAAHAAIAKAKGEA